MKKLNKDFFKGIKASSCLMIAAGCVILAFGMYNIHSVAEVTEGGTLGLALFFENRFGISPSVSSFLLNAICYIIGIKTLGRTFLIYSSISAAVFSAAYAILELFPRSFPQIAEYPLTAAILGAVFVGAGVGLCVRAGGAPCGDDALAMSIEKMLKIKIQWVYLISDLTVLGLSLTYIPLSKILYSLVTVVISGQIIGLITGNRKTAEK